jgi:hypothetical protein
MVNRNFVMTWRFLSNTSSASPRRPQVISVMINAYQDFNKSFYKYRFTLIVHIERYMENNFNVFTVSGRVDGGLWPRVSTQQHVFFLRWFLA